MAQQVIYNRVVAGEPPSVTAAGDLLDTLLAQTRLVPSPLRYTVARARGIVEAPPFESVRELVLALKRFERGDRATVVRGVLVRAAVPRRRHPRASTAVAAIAASALIGTVIGKAVPKRRSVPPAPAAEAPALLPTRELVSPDAPGRPRADGMVPAIRQAVGTTSRRDAADSAASTPTTSIAPTAPPASAATDAAGSVDGDIDVLTIADDGARNDHVRPSPDGSRIAFDSDRDGERAVYIANVDGSDVQRLTEGAYAAVPAWAPDSQRLAFIRAESDRPQVWNIWVMTLATRELRRLTHFGYGQTWGASWFPDGHRIVYSHESMLTILDLATGAERQFSSPVPGRVVRTPAASPDGEHVVFQVSGSGAWVIDLASGAMRCVLTDPTVEEFAWSRDGRRVAFHSRRDGQWGICFMAPS